MSSKYTLPVHTFPAQTIEADSYNMDTTGGKLTFYDKANTQLASFAIGPGAYVKLVGK